MATSNRRRQVAAAQGGPQRRPPVRRGGISQTIATEPDRDYEIRFSMAGGSEPTGPALKTVVSRHVRRG